MRWILVLSLVLAGCQKHIHVTPLGSGRSVTLNWVASTTAGVSYNAYRATGPCPGTAPAKMNTSPITVLTYTDSDVPVGKWCYWATSFLVASASQESVPSNKVDVEIIQQPNPPTNLTISPPAVTMRIGTSQQFAANLPDATWSISPVDMGSIDATGLYRAPDQIQGNNIGVQIIARSSGQVATAQVTLRKN